MARLGRKVGEGGVVCTIELETEVVVNDEGMRRRR